MKHHYLIGLFILIFVGCTEQPSMDSMPCHQMPDGSWMGNCDTADTSEESFDASAHPAAQSSTIVDLADGDAYTITADIITKTINGVEFKAYGYNGMIPGVALRVEKDSTVTINFENNIDQETTIHWHGLRHDIKDDGVPGVSQDPVYPGESYTYTVYFPDEGIYWYHPHIREDVQQDLGLAGNMLVDPITEDYYSPVNREELLVLDDILMDSNGVVPFGIEHANHALMGRFGNVLFINGEEEYALNVLKNEVVRFYVTNVANVRPFNLAFENSQIKLVGSDLGKYEVEEYVDSVIIAPAERYIIEVRFDEPGIHQITHITPEIRYILGEVRVTNTPSEDDYSSEFLTLRENEDIRSDIDSFREYFNKEPDYEIDLTVDMPMMGNMNHMPCHKMGGQWMGDCDDEDLEEDEHQEEGHAIEWEDDMFMMNTMMTSETVEWILKDKNSELENMDIGMRAKVGDVIKIRLFNDPKSDHPMQHPIHLHGQRFLVLHDEDEKNDNLVWKDTTLIPAGETVDILVDVTNPGEWMMHCHIAEHLEAGMMTSLIVEE